MLNRMSQHDTSQTEPSVESRRDFFRTTAASSLLLVSSQTAFTYQANSTVELGLLGCGSRGNWISPFFVEYAGAHLPTNRNLAWTKDKPA